MRTSAAVAFAAFLSFQTCTSVTPASPPSDSTDQQLWSRAHSLEEASKFAEAEAAYQDLLQLDPGSQRVTVRVGLMQEKVGKHQQAISSFDQAFRIDPFGLSAPGALYFKARVLVNEGSPHEARQSIAILKRLHPDSSYSARADLLLAKQGDSAIESAERNLASELEARTMLDGILSSDRPNRERLDMCSALIDRFPQSPTKLQALEVRGHLFIKDKDYAQAAVDFTRILTELKSPTAESRIAQVATTRLAAIAHALGNRDESLKLYLSLAEADSIAHSTKHHALLHGAGVLFEMYQRQSRTGNVSREQWESVRSLCRMVVDGSTEVNDRATADLMLLETFQWEGDDEAVLLAIEEFESKYGEHDVRRQLATARMMAAISARRLGKYDIALIRWNQIVVAYKEESEIWPGMDHLPRVYFERIGTLKRLGVDKKIIDQAIDDLYARFPESNYTDIVRQREKR
jgi:tetratricopeptide (TPR) repeat protein